MSSKKDFDTGSYKKSRNEKRSDERSNSDRYQNDERRSGERSRGEKRRGERNGSSEQAAYIAELIAYIKFVDPSTRNSDNPVEIMSYTELEKWEKKLLWESEYMRFAKKLCLENTTNQNQNYNRNLRNYRKVKEASPSSSDDDLDTETYTLSPVGQMTYFPNNKVIPMAMSTQPVVNQPKKPLAQNKLMLVPASGQHIGRNIVWQGGSQQ